MPTWGKSAPKRRRGRPRVRRVQPESTRISPRALPFLYMLIGALVWTYGPVVWQGWLQPTVQNAWHNRMNQLPEKPMQPKKQAKKKVKKPVIEEKKPEVNFHFYQMLMNKAGSIEERRALSGYALQIGAFKKRATCDKQVAVLKQANWTAFADAYQSHGEHWCHVMVGPFKTLSEAYSAKNQLYRLGYDGILKSYTK